MLIFLFVRQTQRAFIQWANKPIIFYQAECFLFRHSLQSNKTTP